VQLLPDRTTLYRVDEAGVIYNKFRVKVSNRSSQPARVVLSADGLPAARFTITELAVAPGASIERQFEVAAPRFTGAQDVNHFRIVAKADPQKEQEAFDETFLMPPERSNQ
jgi:IG-like fold at C-terminal of FixG, putative oxidoreductase